jgi:hypothetical protein
VSVGRGAVCRYAPTGSGARREFYRPHCARYLVEYAVDKAVALFGAKDLGQPGTAYRIIINEAVELAKIFGAEQGHRFVNGVLDKVARAVRPVEFATRS